MYDIRSPLTRGDICFRSKNFAYAFSIPPHARGDHVRAELGENFIISIHSPHVRGDQPCSILMRGCTHFNPLPSCEGRQSKTCWDFGRRNFNPLPSCEGRRGNTITAIIQVKYFNPLPSCEGRLECVFFNTLHPCDFNPLPSCEGRPVRFTLAALRLTFQSTPLMRGETNRSASSGHRSSHFNPLPSCEGRLLWSIKAFIAFHFNPLPSCEGRRRPLSHGGRERSISIHSPHARGDFAGF